MTLDADGGTGDRRGAWLGVAVGALGWALTALELARGGTFVAIVVHLTVALPLAVVGTVTALAAFGVGRTRMNPVLWLGVVAVAGVVWNFLVLWFRFGGQIWAVLIPVASPTGLDFRDGLYNPARAFSTVNSGWPPFSLIVGKPFTLFSFATAHVIQVVILAALAVASVVFTAVLAARAASGERDAGSDEGRVTVLQLGLVFGLWLVTSTGFIYEMERANVDLYALFFALLAVWLMLRASRSPWWPALALAVSINLKLYPGVLLVLLLWRYRWRAVVPALVTNVALLLIAGPRNLMNTVSGQNSVQSLQWMYWWGNHSAKSFSVVLRQIATWVPSWIYWPLFLVPLAIWVLTLVLLVRRGWNTHRAVLAAAACVPVMCTTPAISHDYKLVLCVFPLAVLGAAVATMGGRRTLVWSLLFGLLSWAMVMLSRASQVIVPSLLNSKYALLVLLQLLLLAVVGLTETGPRTEVARERGAGLDDVPAGGDEAAGAEAVGSDRVEEAT